MIVVTVRRDSDSSSAIHRDDLPRLWCLTISACCASLAAIGRPPGCPDEMETDVTDVQELKRHIQVLEAQAEWDSDTGAELAELGEKVEQARCALDHMTDTFDRMTDALDHNTKTLCAAIDRNTAKLDELVGAYNRLVAKPAPSPLADTLTGRTKPKR
jgi:hypothetical protein